MEINFVSAFIFRLDINTFNGNHANIFILKSCKPFMPAAAGNGLAIFMTLI